MVRQPQGTEWMGDWNAIGEQFWTAWQKGVGQYGAGVGNPAMEQWQRIIEQTRGAEGGHGEMLERGMEGLRQYVDFMQNALQQFGAQSGTAFDPTQLMRGAFRGFDVRQNPVLSALRASAGQGALNVDQLLDGVKQFTEPFRQQIASGMSMPAFGEHREVIERNQALASALMELQEPMALYQGEMLRAARRGLEIFELKLAERAEPGRELSSMRALYDLWIDAAEEGYAEVALSPGFRKAYGAMANAQMRVRQLIQQQVERSTAAFGMPGRTEMDSVLRQLADMRRRLGDAEEQLGELLPSATRGEKTARRTQVKGGKGAKSAGVTKAKKAGKPAKTGSSAKRAKAAKAGKASKPAKSSNTSKAKAGGSFAERLAATRSDKRRG